MAAKFDCIKAAQAVNSLMRIDPRDQEALLEVISDYFCPPPCRHCNSTSNSEEELTSEEGQGVNNL